MISIRNAVIVACSLIGLVACGPLNQGGLGAQLGKIAVDAASGAGQQQETTGSAVSREQLLGTKGQFLRINIRNFDRWDTAQEAAVNGNRTTWVDTQNISYTFENGIIVATRGLIRDLMSAEASQTWAAIKSGGGDVQRTHEFLSNQDKITREVLQCRIDSKGKDKVERLRTSQNSVRFEEVCRSDRLEFTNVYWVGDAGTIIRSIQAVSSDGGFLQIDVF